MICGVVVGAAVSTILGLLLSRSAGYMFAVLTLAASTALASVVNNVQWLGGTSGIGGVSRDLFGTGDIDPEALYVMICAITAIIIGLYARFRRTATGRAIEAMRLVPGVAQASGVDIARLRVKLSVLSGAIGGLAGTLYALLQQYVSADLVGATSSVNLLAMNIIGGSTVALAGIPGAFIVIGLPQMIQSLVSYQLIMVGVITGVIALWLRRGLAGTPLDLWARAVRPLLERSSAGEDGDASGRDSKADGRGGSRSADRRGRVRRVRRRGRARGRVARAHAGSGACARRTERRGQDDAGERARRQPAPDPRHGSARGPGHRRLERQPPCHSRDHQDVPDRRAVRHAHRPRERHARGLRPPAAVVRCVTSSPWSRAAPSGASAAVRSALLDALGAADLADRRVDALTSGQRRLIEIARCLMTDAEVILLDEPAAGLSSTERRQLAAVIRRLAGEGKAILLIEHDMEFVMSLAEEITVLTRGTRLASGAPDAVRADPRVIEAYWGTEVAA